jgi:predicted porin
MKKSLVALAVLAASGAAMAQSSVTLYGRLDAGLANVKTETTANTPANAVASLSQTKIDSSILRTTYWGMKGTEDLGGGLKANFDLQSAFSIDTGALDATGMFARTSTVGLSGNFGSVNLGRQYTSYFTLFAATDNVTNANIAQTDDLWKTGVDRDTQRASNSVRFDSANYGGVSGSVMYGINEAATPATDKNGSNVSFHVKYAAGPILAGVAYEEDKAAYLSTGAASTATKNTLVAGSYNFGVAKLTGGYNKASNATRDDKEYQLGVDVPLSSAAVVMFGYVHSNSTGSGLPELNSKGYTLAAQYSLSKRTALYAGMYKTDFESGNTVAAFKTAKTTAAAVGVVHLF